jgi:hypothetical protein
MERTRKTPGKHVREKKSKQFICGKLFFPKSKGENQAVPTTILNDRNGKLEFTKEVKIMKQASGVAQTK